MSAMILCHSGLFLVTGGLSWAMPVSLTGYIKGRANFLALLFRNLRFGSGKGEIPAEISISAPEAVAGSASEYAGRRPGPYTGRRLRGPDPSGRHRGSEELRKTEIGRASCREEEKSSGVRACVVY